MTDCVCGLLTLMLLMSDLLLVVQVDGNVASQHEVWLSVCLLSLACATAASSRRAGG